MGRQVRMVEQQAPVVGPVVAEPVVAEPAVVLLLRESLALRLHPLQPRQVPPPRLEREPRAPRVTRVSKVLGKEGKGSTLDGHSSYRRFDVRRGFVKAQEVEETRKAR